MPAPLRIGIDLGGTKIAAVALDTDGTVAASRRIAAPRDDYAATLRALSGLVCAIETETGRSGSVGVGIPGSLSPRTGLLRNANSTWLNGRPLGRDLETALARPVRVANDANCLALSEARDGAGRGADTLFGVILGTGCGGGLVIGGRLHMGHHDIAGEWGHNPLPWPRGDEIPGPACWCGRQGCLEVWLSGPGLAADHARATGETLEAHEIAARATAGGAADSATLARHADRLARGLATIVNTLDPDAIVLGGGLSNIAALYELVPPLLPRHVFSDYCEAVLLPPAHGADSGVRGAARLWDEQDRSAL